MSLPPYPSEKAIDAAVRAMRDLLRKRIGELALEFSDFQPFFLSLMQESDRALPIVAFSYIEDKLKSMMESVMNPKITGGAESLFDAFAPLGTASGRIKVAASLYWLNPHTYKNLDLIRKIRNAFAHRPVATSFDKDPVASLMASMEAVEEPPWRAEAARMVDHKTAPPRVLFHIRTCLTCAYMLTELGSAPHALRMGLPPMAAFADGTENTPKPFMDLITSALRVMLAVGAPGVRP